MKDRAELLAWAKAEAQRLEADSANWTAVNTGQINQSHMAAALEFLRSHAAGTAFLSSANGLFPTNQGLSTRQVMDRVSAILRGWAQYVEDGLAEARPLPVEARVIAATDLMEQVQQLLDDPKAHPAAPVVLAGAALEEFLRSRVAAKGVTVVGKPGMNSYASALRSAGDITAQDVKDVTAWAGQRNEAAHGEFEQLSRQRAQIMVDGINLFLRQKLEAP